MVRGEINGITYYDFGKLKENYGLTSVSFEVGSIEPKEIANIPGFFLHPTMPPTEVEIYCLKGTQEQYDNYYKYAVEMHALKIGCLMYGFDFNDRKINTLRMIMMERIRDKFKPWYQLMSVV